MQDRYPYTISVVAAQKILGKSDAQIRRYQRQGLLDAKVFRDPDNEDRSYYTWETIERVARYNKKGVDMSDLSSLISDQDTLSKIARFAESVSTTAPSARGGNDNRRDNHHPTENGGIWEQIAMERQVRIIDLEERIEEQNLALLTKTEEAAREIIKLSEDKARVEVVKEGLVNAFRSLVDQVNFQIRTSGYKMPLLSAPDERGNVVFIEPEERKRRLPAWISTLLIIFFSLALGAGVTWAVFYFFVR